MPISSIGRTQAAASGFIPQVWAQKALDVLRNNIVLARVVARDSDYQNGWQGQTLNIPYPGTFTAQAKTEGNPATVQAPTGGSTVAVTLSQYYTVDILVEDWAQAQANSNLMDRYVQPAVIALAENLENYLFSFYTSLTGSVGTSGTNINHATITSAREALNTAKVPLNDRTLIISPKDEASMIGDTTLQTYFAFARQQGITDGMIGRIDGFDVYMSQLVPVVAGTPNSTKNLAIQRDAFLLAMRALPEPPADSGVKAATIMDPASGLMVRVSYQYSMDYRGLRVAFDMLYGGVCLRPGNGAVVLA